MNESELNEVRGLAAHDEPYTATRVSSSSPFPFSTIQYARLLLLRTREDVVELRDERRTTLHATA